MRIAQRREETGASLSARRRGALGIFDKEQNERQPDERTGGKLITKTLIKGARGGGEDAEGRERAEQRTDGIECSMDAKGGGQMRLRCTQRNQGIARRGPKPFGHAVDSDERCHGTPGIADKQ